MFYFRLNHLILTTFVGGVDLRLIMNPPDVKTGSCDKACKIFCLKAVIGILQNIRPWSDPMYSLAALA